MIKHSNEIISLKYRLACKNDRDLICFKWFGLIESFVNLFVQFINNDLFGILDLRIFVQTDFEMTI